MFKITFNYFYSFIVFATEIRHHIRYTTGPIYS